MQAPSITEARNRVGVGGEQRAVERGSRAAGSLSAPSPEGERLPSGLLDPGGGPRPLPQRPPAVRGRPALPAVAQPAGGAGALGYPGETWGGFGTGSGGTPAVLSLTPLIILGRSSARNPGPTAPSFCPLIPTGIGCWPRRGCATRNSWCTSTTRTFCARICCARPSPWPHCVSCRSAILSTRSVRPPGGARGGGPARPAPLTFGSCALIPLAAPASPHSLHAAGEHHRSGHAAQPRRPCGPGEASARRVSEAPPRWRFAPPTGLYGLQSYSTVPAKPFPQAPPTLPYPTCPAHKPLRRPIPFHSSCQTGPIGHAHDRFPRPQTLSPPLPPTHALRPLRPGLLSHGGLIHDIGLLG